RRDERPGLRERGQGRGPAGQRRRPGGGPGPPHRPLRARRPQAGTITGPGGPGGRGAVGRPATAGPGGGRARRRAAVTRRDRERLTDVLDAIDAIRATWTWRPVRRPGVRRR